MAEGDVTPSQADADFGGGGGGGAGSWISEHKGAAAGAGLVLLVAAYLFLKHRSAGAASSSGSVGTSTGPAVYEVAPGYLSGGYTGSGYGSAAQYGSAIGWDQGLNSQVQPPPAGGSMTGTGTPSSGSSYAGSVNNNAANPAPAPAPNPLAGLTYIPTYAQFQRDVKAGQTIDYVPAGGGAPVPFASGGKVTGSAPAGSRWYTTG